MTEMAFETDFSMEADVLKQLVLDTLDDMKAEDVVVLDVREQTSITLYMVIASGRSDRHLRSIADRVRDRLRDTGFGRVPEERSRDWALLDAGDVLVHVMLPETRQLYALEKLWSVAPAEDCSGTDG